MWSACSVLEVRRYADRGNSLCNTCRRTVLFRVKEKVAGYSSRTVQLCSRNRTERNAEIPLFELEIALPSELLLRNKSYLRSLAQKEGLSQHEIARRLKVSRSGVRDALRRFGLVKKEKPGRRHPGQIPFGWDWKDGKLVKNASEQKIVRWINRMKKAGKSLNGIAKVLNESNVPTKNGGVWQANTVRKIEERRKCI